MTKKTVLVVAAHSDDEAIGCAGTMAKHVAMGDDVYVMYMTDGVGARKSSADSGAERLTSAEDACNLLGVNILMNNDFPDNKMDSVPLLDVTKRVEEAICYVKPSIIYTHHIGDLNIDHRITCQAVLTACRPQITSPVTEIYSFEVLSSTEWQHPSYDVFSPNMFIDITDYIEIKKKALKKYKQEMREPPHSRSIENIIRQAAYRGNNIGCLYAEAFMLVRRIVR